MTRSVVFACALACLGGATEAQAGSERRSAVDRHTGFAFVLDGAALTLSVRAGEQEGDARRAVFGETVAAVCFATYDFRPRGRVVEEFVWPAGQDAVTFTFGRDISREAKACLIEGDGGDIAEVRFGPGPALLFVQTDQAGLAHRRVRSFLRLRDAAGRSVFLKRGSGTRLVEPGRYRLVRYERRCQRSCRVLGPARLRCARRVRLPTRSTRLVSIRLDVERRTCRIWVSSATIAGQYSQPVPRASPRFLSCGAIPFRPSALRRARGYERRDNPAARALRAFLKRSADEVAQPRRGWFLLARRRNQIEFAAGRLPELGAMSFERRDGRWRWVSSGGCSPRAYRRGRAETVTWRRASPSRPPSRDATHIPVLVKEDSCASGQEATGRVLAPWVHYGERVVTVTYFIHPLGGAQTCQGVPATRAVLVLNEPLNGRALRDGGPYPSRGR